MLKERRILGRRKLLSLLIKLYALYKTRIIMHRILLEEEVAEEVEEGINLEAGGQTFPRRKV